MYLGAYNACLADKSLGEALDLIAGLGLTSVEINSGGFLPPIHLPVKEVRESQDARQQYLGEFSSRGLTLTALNCNGNPLHPRADFPHSRDLHESIELAALLGVKRVVTMSGTPGSEPGTSVPVWNPLPWWSPFLDIQDHQWSVAIPYWKDIQARAADADVKIAIEMHPGNIVFNPRTLHRLAEEIEATHVGAEMDPSHLFWQGIDPVLAVADLGELVYNAAAKDTRINEAAKVNGVIDDRFSRVAEGEPGYLPLGGGTSLSGWPTNSSWDFVAVGRGHDTAYWTEFLRALQKVDPDMPVNIEHEDQELDQLEGLRFAAQTLIDAEKAI
ncbi:MAG: sugar phosphate isomerase/epimerase [Intrasporangium sp.]|uniref:sugar phosphate isomerase/epimerase family protein n=1 Tax=Intrasporangium sp. TaxID=1925024 RepID=UPI002648E2D1|nr:sugar phosphate isomerase/epimerase [Intrasporangium sp.]MDN5797073.1 sugar phosphate isomerase/epimerase [Intrasporangium sp.]